MRARARCGPEKVSLEPDCPHPTSGARAKDEVRCSSASTGVDWEPANISRCWRWRILKASRLLHTLPDTA